MLTGILQIIAGIVRLDVLMRFVSRSVVTGFVNALAILIFLAQLPELINVTWVVYALVAGGLGIIYLLPYLTRAVPSPLICIIGLTILSMWLGLDVRTVGDMGELPDSLPVFLLPDVPFNFETLAIIFPYSMTLMVVGLLESLMTATIVDDLTDTKSDKRRECIGQGTANIACGFVGGMASCAMMIMVSIGTFNWASIRDLRKNPPHSSIVMVSTVVVVVLTHDLAKGVLVGVLLSGIFFATKVGRFMHVGSRAIDEGQAREYRVVGQVFFASCEAFVDAFDFREVVDKVVIDVSRAHFWDISAVGALETAKAEACAAGAEEPDGRLRHGSLIESLTEMANELEMVVLGQRHHTDATGKLHLDRTLESVIRGLKCPVLATLERFSAPSRLMIAFDGSPAGRSNIERLANNPLFKGMQCHVVMANDRKEPLIDKMLSWARETLEAQGHETVTDVVIGEPIPVLRDYAKDNAIDLMVTGAFGHSTIRQLIFGSTTSTLLRTSPVPVLVLR